MVLARLVAVDTVSIVLVTVCIEAVDFIPIGSDTSKLASALFRGSLNSYS